jgi:hypothetical protein
MKTKSSIVPLDSCLAFDGAGNLMIGDAQNFRVRRVSNTGIITTLAGDGTSSNSGDEGPAVNAQLDAPTSVVSGRGGDCLYRGQQLSGRLFLSVSFVRRFR